ncbi:uncharacterized protein LOC132334803 isoform X6 [Haemorhous mexicanus]|uniref:uncharacterized protein LOC132334803 isoform X6 n=1 Tax=Haemorhous mexicanus TaxID=30427 RepID=UPI0028BDC685|nr:uncharacterized protein LOC132334803 isoform X6 [Haemorhous mexicanus]
MDSAPAQASGSAAQSERKMKVAVLSVALLFSILLCPPAKAKALLEGTQDDLREPPVAKVLRALLRQKRLAASLDA